MIFVNVKEQLVIKSEQSSGEFDIYQVGGGEAAKALLSLKQYLNYVTDSGSVYCGFMVLWSSDLCLACVQLAPFTSVCVRAACMSSGGYERAAVPSRIRHCQN